MRLLIAASAFLTISGFTALGATADRPWPTYPNAAFTPGKVATTEFREVCALDGNLSYSRRHRTTANDLKSWIFREYGIAPPQGRLARAEWEIDHRVPLSSAAPMRQPICGHKTERASAKKICARHVLVGSSRVDLQACKLEYSIVSPK